MNVALVHDYLREFGGAERVVEAMPRHNVYLLASPPAGGSPRKGGYTGHARLDLLRLFLDEIGEYQ